VYAVPLQNSPLVRKSGVNHPTTPLSPRETTLSDDVTNVPARIVQQAYLSLNRSKINSRSLLVLKLV
jgi:hypothetical protein